MIILGVTSRWKQLRDWAKQNSRFTYWCVVLLTPVLAVAAIYRFIIMIKRLFPDASPIDRSMLVIEALVLLLILLEFVWGIRVRLSTRARDSVDRKVLDYLGKVDRTAKKKVDEIVAGINDPKISRPEAEASLLRLADKFQVENDEQGLWYKSRRYVFN